MVDFVTELWAFLAERRKLWLAPMLAVILVIGALLILAQSSVIAPFIYALF
jgi:hypothetical protein